MRHEIYACQLSKHCKLMIYSQQQHTIQFRSTAHRYPCSPLTLHAFVCMCGGRRGDFHSLFMNIINNKMSHPVKCPNWLIDWCKAFEFVAQTPRRFIAVLFTTVTTTQANVCWQSTIAFLLLTVTNSTLSTSATVSQLFFTTFIPSRPSSPPSSLHINASWATRSYKLLTFYPKCTHSIGNHD